MSTFIWCTNNKMWQMMRSRWNCSVADWTRCSVYPPFHCLGTFRATGSPIEIERGHCEQSGVHKKRFIKTRRGVEEEGSQHIHIFINFQRSISFLVHCCTLSLCYLGAETHVSLHWHWLITVMNWLIDNDHTEIQMLITEIIWLGN